MPATLFAVPALLVAGVLTVSGIAKLRHPDDLSGWADLGVPAMFRRQWLLRLHPWGEIALGLALMLLGGILGIIAGIAALALFVAYLVVVVRAVRAGEDASCACFGARSRITGVTLVRNSWYVLLGLLAALSAGALPLWGGALVAAGWWWLLALAAAAVTVALSMWSAPVAEDAPAAPASDDDLDYLRSLTPAVPLTLADGERINLLKLSRQRPLMLLAVQAGCGSCEEVLAAVSEWRELLPEVSIRLLLREAPDATEATETGAHASLHDPNRYAYDSFGIRMTPTAVLLGADGLLAGGPVMGAADIRSFIDDVYESLHGERPTR